MNDLFRKLNTLVKARVNDVLGDIPSLPQHSPLSPKVDQDIATLRQRINDAIDYEDTLQNRIAALHDEIARLDQTADEAVQQGKDAQARHIIEQMQRTQRRLEMAEADLRAHQLVAQDLIQKVNLLEATVADTRRINQDATDNTTTDDERVNTLSNILSDVRERITGVNEQIKIKTDDTDDQTSDDRQDDKKIEDDLTARRQRLSK